MLKNSHCSVAITAEHRSKFAVLNRQWRRLQMSKQFSKGTKIPKTNNPTKNLHMMPRRDPVKNRYPNRLVIVIDKTNKGSFGFNDENRGSMSCSQKVWHDKDPSVLKNFRCSIFCPFPSIVTSLNERNILSNETNNKIQSTNATINLHSEQNILKRYNIHFANSLTKLLI